MPQLVVGGHISFLAFLFSQCMYSDQEGSGSSRVKVNKKRAVKKQDG